MIEKDQIAFEKLAKQRLIRNEISHKESSLFTLCIAVQNTILLHQKTLRRAMVQKIYILGDF